MSFFKSGFMRGLIAQIIGTVLGMGLVVGIRAILGLEAWSSTNLEILEPIIVGGALVGALSFLIGVGVFSDWFKWTKGISTVDHHDPDPEKPSWWRYFSVDFDHKIIGIQYGVTSLIVLGLGGVFALLFRIELSQAGINFLNNGFFDLFFFGDTNPFRHSGGADLYNSFMSLHGMVMIAAILLGVGAMSNYLIPLLIGANDMAFPRLNAFAYWVNVPGAILLVSSLFLGGFDTGWTGYPPLSLRAPLGVQMFMMGVYLVGLSSIFGSINVIVTVIKMRAPGMTMFKMPIFVWAAFATAIIQLTATQLIGLSFQLVMFQRLLGMNFFDSVTGGNPVLFQHLFWFYSHPAVYVFVLPGFGVISELLPVFSRKPLFGYKWIAFSSMGIALVGFFVWAHHMFTSGMTAYLRVPFMYSTLLVAVPTGVKFFSWVGTVWKGKLRFPTPMLFALGAVVVFLVGGVTGPPNGTVATDLHLHDTYWVVGHFHNTIFGGFMFPLFAAIYFWFPKYTGKMYNEFWGKVHFWGMFIGFEIMSLSQMKIGLLGMRRRIADYDPALGIENAQYWITIAGFVVFFAVLIGAINLIQSARKGKIAEGNVWESRSPEWQIPNPAPLINYEKPFHVVGEPYDYGIESDYVDMNPAPLVGE
ncbi:MAG: cytochrome C oxidase subunit I [Chloroflexi bacterium]|nr:cytochrome C oxidase subunit I [Chloroflexota bacterium]MBT3670814.1 cytochrome C oxidase subunit I [Chloroflexota bacterium]MBT4002348.1 cytochrome C oxidase subunit I [Chloroflexota bacterium]MBT4305273.1 cytochrome C oxidase subunit I [Chloroflexota bacterium]MBT4532419.1 cytochrome C oxidase subunit I [Chloroflexota bacterium]